MSPRPLLVAVFLVVGVGPASGQVIPIRTVPVFQSQQFDLFPSLTMAMGGVSLALQDSLLDPFTNPAKGVRIGSTRLFAAPGLYRVEERAGSGRTLPLGVLGRSGTWFGGLALAVQGLALGERFGFERAIACPGCADRGLDPSRPDRAHENRYVFAMVGKVFPGAGISVGGSVSWAGLNGIQSVDQLYAGAARIKPDGDAVDLRVGALKAWGEGHSASALLVHNRFGVTQSVLYLDPIWDPGTQTQSQRARIEDNVERSRTWGLQLEYVHPLGAPGWRMGWIATTNLKSHPEIPTYRIPDIVQSIWGDPGNSEAFNVGVGIARMGGGSTLGADLIYEPIWSHTWADAGRPTETAQGTTIPPGGKTVENWFRFSNAVVRLGFSQEFSYDESKAMAIRLGLSAHSINYSMSQKDHVQATDRALRAGWVEWTPTWGFSFRFPGWELHYRGSVMGTEILKIRGDDVTVAEPGGGGNILAPITGSLNLNGLRVTTHQFSVSVPIW